MKEKNSGQTFQPLMQIELPKSAQDYVRQTRQAAAGRIQRINAQTDETLRAYLSGFLAGIEGANGKMFDLNPEGTALEEKESTPTQNE